MNWNKAGISISIPKGVKLLVTDGEDVLIAEYSHKNGWEFYGTTITIEVTHWAEIVLPILKKREIIFRAKCQNTGQIIEGNYRHNIRKGTFHLICDKDTNENHYVDRDTLQMKDERGQWIDV